MVYDLSRSIDLHTISTAQSKEKAIAGITSGLIDLNQTVTWKARHFGIWFRLTTKITDVNPPEGFTDEMTQGPFKSMKHIHLFNEVHDGVEMIDQFYFEAPMGWVGKLTDWFILTPYLTRLLQTRNAVIKQYAESDKWKEVLPNR